MLAAKVLWLVSTAFAAPQCNMYRNLLHWLIYLLLLAEEGDVKASIAALHFILSSAAKYSVDGESLANELQQLGLPKGKCCQIQC